MNISPVNHTKQRTNKQPAFGMNLQFDDAGAKLVSKWIPKAALEGWADTLIREMTPEMNVKILGNEKTGRISLIGALNGFTEKTTMTGKTKNKSITGKIIEGDSVDVFVNKLCHIANEIDKKISKIEAAKILNDTKAKIAKSENEAAEYLKNAFTKK